MVIAVVMSLRSPAEVDDRNKKHVGDTDHLPAFMMILDFDVEWCKDHDDDDDDDDDADADADADDDDAADAAAADDDDGDDDDDDDDYDDYDIPMFLGSAGKIGSLFQWYPAMGTPP